MRSRHIEIRGTELRFHFKGKSGKIWRLSIKDRRIARIVRSIQELAGQDLFQYLDEEGVARTIASGDVNTYLQEIAGPDISAKDFRTWAGTVLAALSLASIGPFTSQTQAKANVRRANADVAARLGNTVTICRKCYVHPDVVACYLAGKLPRFGTDAQTARPGLLQDEAAVLRILERAARVPRARAARRAGEIRPAA